MSRLFAACVLIPLLMSSVFAQRTPWNSSRLKGTPETPPAYRVERIRADQSFDHPTSIHEIPGGKFLITQIDGKVFTLARHGDSAAALVGDMAKVAGGSVGCFSAVPDPDFAGNGRLFVCFNNEGTTHVDRFETARDDGSLGILPNSRTTIITWPAGGHNAGCLRFGPDGMLYISTGDGSGPNPPDGLTTGQDVSDLLGSILRIDVRTAAPKGGYAIPKDNPFAKTKGARPEIFAYGLRNPWKFNIDSRTGDVFVADNGWETWEMVHHVRSGQNCGWPVMEGRAELRTEVPVGPTPIVPPARDHHHSEANSVIGGPVYRGGKLPELNDYFIYGDYITGTIWALKKEGDGYSAADVVDTDLRITDFTQGADGELLVLDYDYTGGIYEVVPNDVPDLSNDFPRLLSETGLFTSVGDLTPSAGVTAYDVVVQRWQDEAVATRWVAIPGEAPIVFDGEARSFPEGTVFAKHLTTPGENPQPLETQILHRDNGRWNPYSYIWNDDGSDAALVPPEGANRTVKWRDGHDRTWRASATNECRLCHNAGSDFVLGFQSSQLRKETGKGNSLARLLDSGVVKKTSAKLASWSLVDPHDESQSIDDRARSYLHGNCSSCHHKRGNAIVSFYLKRDLSLPEMKTNKGTGIGTFGMEHAKVIAAGDPFRSVVTYRMSKLGYSRMPYIGSQVVDSKGVALVADWIATLADVPDPLLSPPLKGGSKEAAALHTLSVSQSAGERAAAINLLSSTSSGSLALANRMHKGLLSQEDTATVLRLVKDRPSDIRGLFDTFVPESQRKKTLGTTFDPQVVLSREGDLRRGKLVLQTTNARCRLCHDVMDASKSIGPTLTEVAKKHKTPADLLTHILKPSQKIDEKFAAWIVVTDDGRVFTGLKVKETQESVTLKAANGQTTEVLLKNVDAMQRSKASLMPNGVLSDLTAQEAADLLAFIGSLAK